MRLSILMGVPLAAVLSWPDHHVRLQLALVAVEGTAQGRIEQGIAGLSCLVYNRTRGKDEKAHKPSDHLSDHDPWNERPAQAAASGLTPEEVQMMGYLANPGNPQT